MYIRGMMQNRRRLVIMAIVTMCTMKSAGLVWNNKKVPCYVILLAACSVWGFGSVIIPAEMPVYLHCAFAHFECVSLVDHYKLIIIYHRIPSSQTVQVHRFWFNY